MDEEGFGQPVPKLSEAKQRGTQAWLLTAGYLGFTLLSFFLIREATRVGDALSLRIMHDQDNAVRLVTRKELSDRWRLSVETLKRRSVAGLLPCLKLKRGSPISALRMSST